MKKLLAILIIVVSFAFRSGDNKFSSISLNVHGIEKIQGNLSILIFNQEEGFPEAVDKAIMQLTVDVTSKNMVINLGELPKGKYAISLIHDENNNKEFDKNIIGIPKESFGFTNVDRVYFGPPSFSEAEFEIKDSKELVSVKMLRLN